MSCSRSAIIFSEAGPSVAFVHDPETVNPQPWYDSNRTKVPGARRTSETQFRTNGNKTRWWFVVHGPEEILALLDEQWPAVKIQTAWSLESCFASKETVPDGSSVSPSEPSPLPVSKHPQTASVSNSPAVALDISAHEAEIVSSHRSPTSQPFLDHK